METTEAQPTQPLSTTVGCLKCGRDFKNAIALRMHDIRKHQPGRGWETGRNFKSGFQSKEASLAKKREYNRVMRERYYAQGRDSRGKLRPAGWKPRSKKAMPVWSPERRAKFNSTWRSKNRAKKKDKIQIVYPDPSQKAIQNTWGQEDQVLNVTIPTLKFCPHCGENVGAWRYQP